MADQKILKGVMAGLGELGAETLKKTGEEGQKMLETVISGKELLGLEKTMDNQELEFKKQEEERKKQEEVAKLKQEMGYGRKVETEMTELRKQKEKEEEEKEEYFEKVKQQQEREKQQQAEEYNDLMAVSSNPAKQKKSRGSALVTKKKHQPDMSQMSQTTEFKGKID